MAFCLIKKYADKFKRGLITGEINPSKLVSMSSPERRAYLANYIGEFNAKGANTLFESKLLLKNQQRGLINWAKKLSGLSEKSRIEIIDKISKLEKALTPETERQFLSDIVEQRLGAGITTTEAKVITELSQKARSLFDSSRPNWEQSKAYWKVRQSLSKYMRDIKPDIIAITSLQKIKKGLTSALSIERAIKTGYDLSAPLRQGRAYFGTKEWSEAFKNMFNYAKSQSALDDLEVKMMSNKYSEQAIKNKHTLGLTLLGENFTQREEQFGSKLIDKIPLLRGSERAFTGFLNELRFNRFTNILKNLDEAGRDITDNSKMVKELASVIGASTGRGTLGGFEASAKAFSTVLFSPRWIASRIQMITNPALKGGIAREEAIKSLARLAGTSLAILGMAKMAGADVETDPRSADFAKIKIGKTRFDISGGLGPYIVLFSRIGTKSTKSSTSGKIRALNTGKYGAPTVLDTLYSFVESKTSPVASILRDLAKGTQFGGEKTPEVLSQDFIEYAIEQLFIPLIASDSLKTFDDASGGVELGLLSGLASLFGIGVTTYK